MKLSTLTAKFSYWKLLFAGNAIFLIYLVWFRLNPIQVDVGGHIASANTFARGFFHFFNDQMFMGYIPNLFYPPLEDLLVTLITAPLRHPLFSIDSYNAAIWGFQIYLTLLFSITFYSIYRIGFLLFDTSISRAVFYLGFLCVFCADKTYAIANQGIGAIDTLCIGLSSQLLSFIPFAWLIRELHTKQRPRRIALLMLLLVLSHLVTGIGAFILVAIHLLTSKNRKPLLTSLTLAVFASAFFTLPFMAYQDFLVNRTILLRDALTMPTIIALATLLFIPKSRDRLPITVTILILTLSMPLAVFLSYKNYDIPRVHFYRFVNIGLLCFIFVLPEFFKSAWLLKLRNQRLIQGTLLILLTGVFAFTFKPYRNLKIWFFADQPVKVLETSGTSIPEDGFGRSFVISNQRTIDFGVESLLTLTRPDYRGTKGLYWESARGNNLANSYFANMIDFAVILDATVYMDTPCSITKSLYEQFFRDYAVTSLIYDTKFGWEKRTPWTAKCWKEIERASGTPNFQFMEIGKISAETESYKAFKIIPKNPEAARFQQLIEVVSPKNFREIPIDQKHRPFVSMINDRFKSAQESKISDNLFLDAGEYQRFGTLWKRTTATSTPKVSIQKLEDGKYLAKLPKDQPVWVSIKLASLPGWTWKDQNGKEWPLLNGFPSLIAEGQGEMILEWKRPTLFWIGYVISAFTALTLLALWAWQRKLRTSSHEHR